MTSVLPMFVLERQRALLSRDWVALAQLLDPDLCYVHSSGLRHDREEYMAFARDSVRVESLRLECTDVQRAGAATVVTGRLHQTIVRLGEAEPADVTSWVTEVWRLTGGWRLLAFQSTRLPK